MHIDMNTSQKTHLYIIHIRSTQMYIYTSAIYTFIYNNTYIRERLHVATC